MLGHGGRLTGVIQALQAEVRDKTRDGILALGGQQNQ